MRAPVVVAAALVAAACSTRSRPSPGGGPSAPTPPAAPVGPRPAAITDQMNQTFALYVERFEKIAGDIEHAETCAAAATAVRADSATLDALAVRGDELSAQMVAQADSSAGAWFEQTYGPRFKRAIDEMATKEKLCGGDAGLRSAMEDAMRKFPMLRKKPETHSR